MCLSDALHDKDMTYTDGSGNGHKLSDIKFSYWNQAGTEIKNISINDMFEKAEYVKDTNEATPISLARVCHSLCCQQNTSTFPAREVHRQSIAPSV